ncbi:GtrA family protein [Pseudomonas sp. 18175]|uniref:GtrA family protein n=1 Tax=Pseudomonas sp. 18175 TaxID=3390056 RepID=UPI003D20B7CA
MTGLWKGFSSYAVIGIANTVIHWQLFFVCRAAFEFSQAVSNLLAFGVAATFSFYMNALYTFTVPASWVRYLIFIASMGGLSLLVGGLADHWHLPAIITVVVFSLLSLVLGFWLSKWVVFRERRR